MDFTGLAAIASGLKGAADIGRSAIDARDSAKLASTVAQMNDKILDAQQRLFVVGAEAMALQDELTRAKQEVLELKASLKQRDRYVLAEVIDRQFAYKLKVEFTEDGAEDREPMHYACQPCLDKGIKSVLRFRHLHIYGETWKCPVCAAEIN